MAKEILGAGKVPDFLKRGLCAQTDPEAFFPEKGGSTNEAKKVCLECDERAECLEYALENGEKFGVWGGEGRAERDIMLRQRQKLAQQAMR